MIEWYWQLNERERDFLMTRWRNELTDTQTRSKVHIKKVYFQVINNT